MLIRLLETPSRRSALLRPAFPHPRGELVGVAVLDAALDVGADDQAVVLGDKAGGVGPERRESTALDWW